MNGRYRIAVRRIADGGGGSPEIHTDVAAGDTVQVRGPRNAFPFIDSPSYLFIAGGIGITPILPMARATARGPARWNMVYLGRSRASLLFLDELSMFAGDALEIRPDDENGLPDVAELLSRAEPGAAIYVCGPPPLLEAARALVPTLNPSGSLHMERFSAPPVVGGEPFEVELRRSGITVPVAADESALAAIRRQLSDVTYSCQQGYCGTCKASVLHGEVEHRDTRLLDSERPDSMLICVSRAAPGSSLAIDL
jgi:ferredoxin-NADP reductase